MSDAERKQIWKEKLQKLIEQRVKDNTEGFISLFKSTNGTDDVQDNLDYDI